MAAAEVRGAGRGEGVGEEGEVFELVVPSCYC